jgi:Reverse transcriptase (RNA-dependent DNA polymerase)/Endonuclease-reverse transcriptase
MSNNQPLKIMFWNANGILNKTQELQALAIQLKLDIILISETKLIPRNCLKLTNYFTYRTDNPRSVDNGNGHGGTAILIHRRIPHKQVCLKTTMSTTSVIISSGSQQITISAAYKSPNQALDPLDLTKLTTGSDWFIAAGDFNAKHPLWNSRLANTAGKILYQHAQNSDYSIIAPDSPTYFPNARKNRPDVLDIAITKLPHQTIEVTNLNQLSSDHNPILLIISESPITTSPPQNHLRVNWRKFENELTRITHNSKTVPCNNKTNIDLALNNFTQSIITAVNTSTYTKSTRPNGLNIPKEIAQEIAQKNRLRREWQNTRNPETKRQLNNKISFIRSMLATHRNDEWDKFLDSVSSDVRSLHKLNKKLLNKSTATNPLSGPNGLIFSAADKAEAFADFFEKQFKLNPGPVLPEVHSTIKTINESPIPGGLFTSPGNIHTIIKHLPKRKAPGEDSISNTALKYLPFKSIVTLTNIVNGCLRLGYFPDQWKPSILITIKKPRKEPTHPSSYRPIALLSSVSKVFEKVILHFLRNEIGQSIRPEQHAFREGHSTTTQLVNLVDQLCVRQNNNQKTTAVFLDIEKAFDRVWHNGLLHKLYHLGTSINLLKIIKSFLQHRTFKVRNDNILSSPRPILAGVPQGSCLSPLLYSAYTNDIPVLPGAQVALFADDTLFQTSDKNPRRAQIRLHHQTQEALKWFSKWRLRVNAQKTVAIIFNQVSAANIPPLTFDGHQVPWSNSATYLGVKLDRFLSFNDHVDEIVKKATRVRSMLYPILNNRSPIPTTSKIMILQLYIRSVLSYAGPAWGALISKSNWRKIEAVQNIALRTIFKSPYYVSNKTLLTSARITPIRDFILQCSKSLFYKCKSSKYQYLQNLGSTESTNHNHRKPRPIDWTLQ